MFRYVGSALLKPFIQLWLEMSTNSWLRFPNPVGAPTVHGPGNSPARILLSGSGIAAGHGVLTHDLALAGQLARRLAALTNRGVDIDIVARAGMTAKECTTSLASLELSRFDAIVLAVGVIEALGLRPSRSWREDMSDLIGSVRRDSPAETQIFVVALPMFSPLSKFPRVFEHLVTHKARAFNAITVQICADLPHTTVVEVDHADAHRAMDGTTHERWASQIAPPISEKLRHTASLRREITDEGRRQDSLDELDFLDSAPSESFDLIASIARDLFDVPMAAITFIDEDRQWMKSAIGFRAETLPRADAFCNVTIEEARQFVLEDARKDARFVDSPLVVGAGGVRFYAGYPIESPEGYRLGALCVMDVEPRRFTPADASLLRSLALRVQDLLWEGARR
ncbi:GAF domain-containing protein [Lacisediminihabitans sp. FW035]